MLKFSFLCVFYSVAFVWTLASTDAGVSTIVPVTNGLKFFFTYITGKYICNEVGDPLTYKSTLGLLLIATGVILQQLNT